MKKLKLAVTAKRHRDPRGQELADQLKFHIEKIKVLHGISDPAALDCLVKQLLDAIRRVEYVKRLSIVRHKADVADPSSDRFDPLKAAAFRSSEGDADDAIWLTFLAVHFGKSAKYGWALVKAVYGRLGEQGLWDWKSVTANPDDFCRWLTTKNGALKQYSFSNHRKYESLSAITKNGTGSVIRSFVCWIEQNGSMSAKIRELHKREGQDPTVIFDALYKEMKLVRRFGRLGKFDFLTLIGKLGLAPIYPGSAYIRDNATGPYKGICLLVTGNRKGPLTRSTADACYVELSQSLGLGMQELEDGICNWQKSPTIYRYFRG